MKKTLLIMMKFLPEYRSELEAQAPGFEIIYSEQNPPSEDALKRASYIWGNPSKEQLALCENLEWLQLQSAGHEMYTQPGVLPKGTVLCNCSGAYGAALSEFLLALTFSLTRKLHLYRDNQAGHEWRHLGQVQPIINSKVLVVGLGDIGGQYARKMNALGARVSGIRRNISGKPDYVDALYSMDQLDEVLPRFDIVTLCLPNNPDTAGLFNRERIAKMKPGAVIFNIGRGTAIDTEALCGALESGALGGAGLDVTDPEPLPPGHRLWDIKTALITPHCAGGEKHDITYPSIIGIWRENLGRMLAGETPKNKVDLENGYRVN